MRCGAKASSTRLCGSLFAALGLAVTCWLLLVRSEDDGGTGTRRRLRCAGRFVPADVQPSPGQLVLVTGGAGFIGSHVVAALLHHNFSVRVLDDLSTGNASSLPAHLRLELRVGDVGDAHTAASAAAGCEFVVHLAAVSRVLGSLSPEAALACARVNVMGTLSVLEAARAARVRRFVYAGSSTAYGGEAEEDESLRDLATQAYGFEWTSSPLLPSNEGDLPKPTTPYAATKHAGEVLVSSYDATFGLHTASLRLFMVYGDAMGGRSGASEPREGPRATVVGRFVAAAAAGAAARVSGDGSQSRDLVHVADVARAFALSLQRQLPRRAVINIGSGARTSVAQLAAMAGAVPPHRAPPRRLDIRATLADTCAAQRLLGWAPRVPLADGLAAMMPR